MLLLVETKHNCEIAQRSDLKTKRDLFKVDTRLGAPPLRRELEEEVEVDHVVPLLLLLPADHDFLLQAARNFHPREFLPRHQQPQLANLLLYLLLRSWPMRMRGLLV